MDFVESYERNLEYLQSIISMELPCEALLVDVAALSVKGLCVPDLLCHSPTFDTCTCISMSCEELSFLVVREDNYIVCVCKGCYYTTIPANSCECSTVCKN